MLICKFCGRECNGLVGLGRHTIVCKLNPNGKIPNRLGVIPWNKGKTKETDDRVSKLGEKISESFKDRPTSGCCTKEWNQSIQGRANASKGGGYRENSGHSKKFKVIDSFGKETTLQSSYELECSQLLDKLQIKWNRPKAMKYGGRNYFADFYLPEYDVYLDPKNNYKAKLDAEKIAAVIEENKVKLFVLLKEQITEEYIGMLIQR
jgi:hypothetical protein